MPQTKNSSTAQLNLRPVRTTELYCNDKQTESTQNNGQMEANKLILWNLSQTHDIVVKNPIYPPNAYKMPHLWGGERGEVLDFFHFRFYHLKEPIPCPSGIETSHGELWHRGDFAVYRKVTISWNVIKAAWTVLTQFLDHLLVCITTPSRKIIVLLLTLSQDYLCCKVYVR